MLDSSWNSSAFQEFCTLVVIRNGKDGRFILADAETGNVYPRVFSTKEEAEQGRRQLYDNQ